VIPAAITRDSKKTAVACSNDFSNEAQDTYTVGDP